MEAQIKSLIQSRNGSGPNTYPWVTPNFKILLAETKPFTETYQ